MVDDLVSRGHCYQDVVDGYPAGLVLNLAQAGRRNRRQEALGLAIGVSLGIRDALSREGLLVKSWLQEDREPPDRPPAEKSEVLQPWLHGLPVVKKVRRKDG